MILLNCHCIQNTLYTEYFTCAIVAMYNLLLLLCTICCHFTKMCDVTKRWPSDKVKENSEANLKVHCVMQLLVSYEVFRWHPLNNRLYS